MTLEQAVNTGPTGADARIIFYSASQLTFFLACKRKWWFQYVAGFKPSDSKSRELGKVIHKHSENALRDGKLPSDDRAEAGLAELSRLEAAGSGNLSARLRVRDDATVESYLQSMANYVQLGEVKLESRFEIELPPNQFFARRRFVGNIDLYDKREPCRPKVIDYKTMSDLKYAKTEYELATDVQMNVYGFAALQECTEADAVTVQHIAIPTKGRITGIACEATLDRPMVERAWSSYLPILDEMDEARANAINAAAVPADGLNNGECERYGGCAHKERCAAAIFSANIGANEMANAPHLENKLATLRQRTKGDAPTQPNAPASSPPAAPPSAPPAAAAPSPAAPSASVPNTPAAPAPTMDVGKLAKLRGLGKAAAAAPSQPSPEAPPAQPAPTQAAAPPKNGGVVDIKTKLAAQAAAKASETPAPPLEQSAPPAASTPTAPALPQGFVQKSDPMPTSATRIGLLLIDCVPLAGCGLAMTLESWVEPVLETIKKATGVSWQLHDYGKGSGLICDGIATLAAPDVLVLDSTTKLGKAALEAVTPRADIVIRGTR